ncbi:polyphosphate kinase [Mycolicibacterium aromaticivorans JS19b1 = JCM 16368]|uniref:Polyphosphate kinase n=1 Tax=Mycolicibacterium aromaticivorans JS19b1 = JCM 16368 TaxID=1440774 RepID=A0A064CBT8_9MYCO|nr:polyphosphate kinase [Mycolicibacterium aromaticivorans JS19b1 = JCM 16368]
MHALRAIPGACSLADLDTAGTPGFVGSKSDALRLLQARGKHLHTLQEKLYANAVSGNGRSVLLVLQGMDAAGKGGIIRHVLGMVNPEGIDHAPFGVPSSEERLHHFLWRVHKALPRLGHIGVFDRSHYEDVLVARVRKLVPEAVWQGRYHEINEFERQLAGQGMVIVKVAMFISLQEQKQRLLQRLRDPHKNWKYSPRDVDDRLQWPHYRDAYQALLDRTSTEVAPWYVIPCDHKWYSRIAVAELLIAALETMDLTWPPAQYDLQKEITRLQRS